MKRTHLLTLGWASATALAALLLLAAWQSAMARLEPTARVAPIRAFSGFRRGRLMLPYPHQPVLFPGGELRGLTHEIPSPRGDAYVFYTVRATFLGRTFVVRNRYDHWERQEGGKEARLVDSRPLPTSDAGDERAEWDILRRLMAAEARGQAKAAGSRPVNLSRAETGFAPGARGRSRYTGNMKRVHIVALALGALSLALLAPTALVYNALWRATGPSALSCRAVKRGTPFGGWGGIYSAYSTSSLPVWGFMPGESMMGTGEPSQGIYRVHVRQDFILPWEGGRRRLRIGRTDLWRLEGGGGSTPVFRYVGTVRRDGDGVRILPGH